VRVQNFWLMIGVVRVQYYCPTRWLSSCEWQRDLTGLQHERQFWSSRDGEEALVQQRERHWAQLVGEALGPVGEALVRMMENHWSGRKERHSSGRWTCGRITVQQKETHWGCRRLPEGLGQADGLAEGTQFGLVSGHWGLLARDQQSK
jgi:hypothetical protein